MTLVVVLLFRGHRRELFTFSGSMSMFTGVWTVTARVVGPRTWGCHKSGIRALGYSTQRQERE